MKRHPLSSGDDRGQILILTALTMTVLLGISALAIDASFAYDKRNRLYAAADAAAKSGAIEVHRNSAVTDAQLQCFANQQVTAHGFSPSGCSASGTTNVVIRRCNNVTATCEAAFAGNANFVEALVSESSTTFFGYFAGLSTLTPGARAIAGSAPGSNCIVTLGTPSASPTSLDIGNSTLNMPGCAVADNGNLTTSNPSTRINALSIGITGACTGQACPQANQQTGVPPTSDPLSGLVAPTMPGTCSVPLTVSTTTTLTPGCYSSITLANNTSVTLAAGSYYLTGAFTTGNFPNVSGSGVFIYLAGTAATGPCVAGSIVAGCFNIGNNATFTLSAQTSGAYTGILFWQASTDQLNASFDGNSPTYNLSGAEYFPNADVSFRNGMNATNDCTLFVARSLFINNGNGSFSNTCSAYGGSPILTVVVVQ